MAITSVLDQLQEIHPFAGLALWLTLIILIAVLCLKMIRDQIGKDKDILNKYYNTDKNNYEKH